MIKQSMLWVIGAGGHGRAVAEAAQLGGWQKLSFIDDVANTAAVSEIDGWPVVGPTDRMADFLDADARCVVAIGNQGVRARLAEQVLSLGAKLESIIHPAAWVSPKATVAKGCVVMAGAVVGTYARLGQACIVNANATVDHDAVLEDYAHLGVGVQLAGGVVVKDRAWLQAGCSAGYRVVVGSNAVVGPGTVLVADDYA